MRQVGILFASLRLSSVEQSVIAKSIRIVQILEVVSRIQVVQPEGVFGPRLFADGKIVSFWRAGKVQFLDDPFSQHP